LASVARPTPGTSSRSLTTVKGPWSTLIFTILPATAEPTPGRRSRSSSAAVFGLMRSPGVSGPVRLWASSRLSLLSCKSSASPDESGTAPPRVETGLPTPSAATRRSASPRTNSAECVRARVSEDVIRYGASAARAAPWLPRQGYRKSASSAITKRPNRPN
jgi:hypothetical protein